MFSKKVFAERFKEIRISNNLLQPQMAAILGLQKSSISLIEKGERAVSIEVLTLICEHFNVSADYLLGLKEE